MTELMDRIARLEAALRAMRPLVERLDDDVGPNDAKSALKAIDALGPQESPK